MISSSTDKNVAIHEDPERQKGPDVSQGKMQAGRTVKPSVVQLPGRMAAASDTFQRTTTHCTTAARSAIGATITASVDKSRMTGMETQPESTRAAMFQQQVLVIVEDLTNREKMYKSGELDALTFCLDVVNTFDNIKKKDKIAITNSADGNSNYRFMLSRIAPFYETALEPALQILQDHTKAGRGWICQTALSTIARVIKALGSDTPDHKKTLAGIYRQLVEQELDYMEYLKDFPDMLPLADTACHNISWLVSDHSPVCFLDLLDKDTRAGLEEKGHHLLQDIQLSARGGDAGGEREKTDKSRRNVSPAVADIYNRRKHYEQLRKQFSNIMNARGKTVDRSVDYQKNIDFLKKLHSLCDEYNEFFVEYNIDTTLHELLKRTISSTVKMILLEMYCADETVRPEDEAMSLINQLAKDNWLYNNCLDIYRICTEPEDVVGSAVKNNMTQFANYNRAIGGIHALLDVDTRENCIMAMDSLIEMITGSQQQIQSVDFDGTLQNRMEKAAQRGFKKLFKPVFENHRQFTENLGNSENVSEKMSQFKEQFIELNPYTCIIDNERHARTLWKRMACLAWFGDIDKLCTAESFSNVDLDNLLKLKDIAPDVPHSAVQSRLGTAVSKLLMLMKKGNIEEGLAEKVAKLSEWAGNLPKAGNINQNPKKQCSKKRARRHRNTAGKRTSASSDTPAGTIPAPLNPDAVNAIMGVYMCYLQRQQIISHGIQAAIANFSHMSAPAPRQLFQQPASGAGRAPVAQPPAGIRLPPGLAWQPALSCISAPALCRPFQQPASGAGHAPEPVAQLPTGIRLRLPPGPAWQPALSCISAPALCRPFQQPASDAGHAPVARQQPAGIRLPPGLALQQPAPPRVPALARAGVDSRVCRDIQPQWQTASQQLSKTSKTSKTSKPSKPSKPSKTREALG